MEIMIENFTCPLLFGKDNLEFFSEVGLHSDTENHLCSDDNSLNNKVQGDYWITVSMSMCLYVYVLICLCVYMSICICMCIHTVYVYTSLCLCIYMSVCMRVNMSVCKKSLCLYVYVSMCLWVKSLCVYMSKVYVCCLTWSFNCRLLIKEKPWHIRHFTCWLEHIKTKRKPLLLIQNYYLLASHKNDSWLL